VSYKEDQGGVESWGAQHARRTSDGIVWPRHIATRYECPQNPASAALAPFGAFWISWSEL